MAADSSTYFFIARLEPFDECRNFNPGELRIRDGWVLDICTDLICLWNPEVSQPFADLRPFMSQALDVITALYIFRSKRVISYQLRNWIECKELSCRKNMIGAFLAHPVNPRASSRVNVTWKRAAKAFPKVFDTAFLRLAVKDYAAALKDRGDDAFLFAYRGIESICRGISGATTEFKPTDWAKMHSSLGTSKSLVDPLLAAAKEIRHGDVSGPNLASARRSREAVLDISRNVLSRALKKHCPGFL